MHEAAINAPLLTVGGILWVAAILWNARTWWSPTGGEDDAPLD